MNKDIIFSNQITEYTDNETERQMEFMSKAKAYVSDLEKELGRKPVACVITFGCQMNARDSEKLIGILENIGYEISENEDSDFVIYNTCTVRDNADQRVFGRLGLVSSYKKKKPWMKIALCGCMMQEQVSIEKIKKSYRYVDLIFGTFNLFKFAELLCTMFESDRMIIDIWRESNKIVEDCIVPYVRGREKSRRPIDILREAEKLAADGVKEIMLLGQNVNSYGIGLDEEDKITFAQLIEQVCKIDGIERVRFMSSHPKDLSDELIATIRDNPKIARHIHLALQSGSDRILKRMNRHYTKEDFLKLVEKIRKEVPDVAITTDIIVGFPGETKEDVDETIDVVKKAAFENAFTFIYSKRVGTPAASFEDQVPEEEVKENFNRLLEVVQETAHAQSGKFEGSTQRVLVEEVNEHDNSLVTGRMSNNTLVHFPGDASLIGTFVNVHLDECHGFYYTGKMEEN